MKVRSSIEKIMNSESKSEYTTLLNLSEKFWLWRAEHMPLSYDDIPRMDRPSGWVPDWSQEKIAWRRNDLAHFEDELKTIDAAGWPIDQQVDYRLLQSALARVHWELDVTRSHELNADFYVHQTLGAIFLLLLSPKPFDAGRSREVVTRMNSIPRSVEHGKKNLTGNAVRPFALAAIDKLKNVRDVLNKVVTELKPVFDPDQYADLEQSKDEAVVALEDFHDWLKSELPTMSMETAVGREGYSYFLKHVACLPYTPEELLKLARQEWERSVNFELFERLRNEGIPQLPVFESQAAQIKREAELEEEVRKFLEEKDILSVPGWVKHYHNLPLPAYVAPLTFMGVTDDLTSPSRLDQDGISYIKVPSTDLDYFSLSIARDPRPLIVHEGVPGHYLQMVLSWAHENPIRRHYYDSGPNEGIGFYAEELMMQFGLFDDSPRTREVMYSFLRLRALRVEVDVRMATGSFTIEQAAEYLQEFAELDPATAWQEAVFFASAPGQAITYQIGKLQIVKFLADAKRTMGEAFNLRKFHDYLWLNGNVPISLLRWEYLGLDDEISV